MRKIGFCPIMQATEKQLLKKCDPKCAWYDPESGECAVFVLAKATQKHSDIVQEEIDSRLGPRTYLCKEI